MEHYANCPGKGEGCNCGPVALLEDDAFKVTADTGTYFTGVRYVEAEAGEWRFTVVVSELPEGHKEGGPYLVTVLHPWQAAHTMQGSGYLAASYVAEHLTGGKDREPPDVAALTLLVRFALDRMEYPPL